jgi:hypothetical protein
MSSTTELWADVWRDALIEAEQKHELPLDQWRTAGRRTKANPDGETLDWWQGDGLQQIEKYKEWLETCGWEIATMPDGKPGIEWEAQVTFGGSPIRLIVDGIYSNGQDWIVVDYKTGSRTPTGVMQLGLYASAIEQAYDIRPKWGAYYMTRKAALDDLTDLTPWGIDFFDQQFAAMNAYMGTGFFPANVGDHCSYCSYRDYCIAVNGSKSAKYPMNNPLKEGKS